MVGDSMIKNIRLFVNKNKKSIKFAHLVRNKLNTNDFKVIEDDNDDFSLGIAICKDKESKYFSLNETVIKDINSKVFKADVYIENDFLENYVGDGIMLVTSIGSTAHNLSYNGSIIYPSFSSLQITPMAPINSNRYRPLTKSVIISEEVNVDIILDNENLVITFDGEDTLFSNADSINSKIGKQKIKVLRFDRYGFANKINEKLL